MINFFYGQHSVTAAWSIVHIFSVNNQSSYFPVHLLTNQTLLIATGLSYIVVACTWGGWGLE